MPHQQIYNENFKARSIVNSILRPVMSQSSYHRMTLSAGTFFCNIDLEHVCKYSIYMCICRNGTGV